MSTQTLELDIPPDSPTILIRRFVKAPPELVFTAMTEPRHLRRWWGPRNLELVVCEVDLRVGGGYRFVHRAPDGSEFGFHGSYRELDPPRRVVQTFVYEGAPDHPAVETMELQPVEGGTLLVATSVHDSVASRDAHVASGMEAGMRETYERLDELLAGLAPAAGA